MRIFLILLLTLFLGSQLYSQKSQDDVVYLNNGTYFRGKIVELIPGVSLRISFPGKDTLDIQMKDVKYYNKPGLCH